MGTDKYLTFIESLRLRSVKKNLDMAGVGVRALSKLPSLSSGSIGRVASKATKTPGLLCLPQKCFYPSTIQLQRYSTQEEIEEERQKQISWFQWLKQPLEPEKKPEVDLQKEQEEKIEIEEFLSRVHACYFKKPPEEPGIEFFIEGFHLCMKYDKWRGVETLWRMSQKHGFAFEDQLIDEIEDYLLRVRERQWHEEI